MPKKKTGQRKKAEKQKARQKDLRKARANRPLAELPCNLVMVNFLSLFIPYFSLIEIMSLYEKYGLYVNPTRARADRFLVELLCNFFHDKFLSLSFFCNIALRLITSIFSFFWNCFIYVIITVV